MMPTFLSDPVLGVYLVLVAFVVIAGVIVARKRDRRSWISLGIAVAVLLLVGLIDLVVESPREEATRKVKAMAEAATTADPGRFVEHVSTSFEANGKNRDDLKAAPAWHQIRTLQAKVTVWGFGHDAHQRISDTEVEVGFYAKGEAPGSGMVMRYVRARFVKDSDGEYRLKSLKFYNPAERGLNAEEPIPGFP
jgi:hypothetical protein